MDSNNSLTGKLGLIHYAVIISLEHRPCTRLVCLGNLVKWVQETKVNDKQSHRLWQASQA
jgi:hypothetical protein